MADGDSGLPFTPGAVTHFHEPDGTAVAGVPINAFARRAAEQFAERSISPAMLRAAWRLADLLLVAAAGLAVYLAYVGASPATFPRYLAAAFGGAAIGVLAIQLCDGYDVTTLRLRKRALLRAVAGWTGAVAVIALALFFLKSGDAYSRVWLGTWYGLGAAVLSAGRLALGAAVKRWARNGVMERRAVIVGGGKAAETLIRDLEMQPGSDIRICGIFDDRSNHRSPPLVAGYPKLGTVSELVEFARLARIDMLIVTLPLSAEARVASLLKTLWVLPLDIRLSAHSAKLRFRPRSYSYVGEVALLDVFDRPLADWDWIVKRGFDLVFASLALLCLMPLMVATALAIKLDSRGPVLFRQKRHGFNNQVIDVLKFRSLYHEMSDPAASTIVTRDDKRVTRVGRFIRKSSIDELPQLFNVLRGDLSLVGPRPHAVHAKSSMNQTFVEIVEGYFGRHKVKPGITGWAQIKGWRGEIDQPEKLKKRFEHDLYYIENWSIFLDAAILVLTPLSLLKSGNAY